MIERSVTVAGHPGISWSIVLDALVEGRPDQEAIARGLARAWPQDGSAGPLPEVAAVAEEAMDAEIAAMANRPYAPDGPLVRLTVSHESGRVAVAAHHAAVDGLGLLAVLGAALGGPVGTSARGLAARARGTTSSPGRRALYPFARAAEGLFMPPARVEPDGGDRSSEGDHLLSREVPDPADTARLVSASARAIASWNRTHGRPRGRIVLAVGASLGGGKAPVIGRQAAWLRIPVPDPGVSSIHRSLLERAPPPPEPAALMRAARRFGVATALERRTGSTALVSNLGQLEGDVDRIARLAFYPSAHGRSGMAVGAAGYGGGTCVTVRARRRDLGERAAARLLDLIVIHLADLGDGEDPVRGSP